MASIGDQRSFGDLLRDLTSDFSGLFRKEVQLAKAEAKESVAKAMTGVEFLLGGAVLGLGALGVLLGAAVSVVSAILMAMGMGEAGAAALAAVIVGGIVAIIAYTLIKRGIDALKAENLWLDRTVHSVSRDAEVLKEKVNG